MQIPWSLAGDCTSKWIQRGWISFSTEYHKVLRFSKTDGYTSSETKLFFSSFFTILPGRELVLAGLMSSSANNGSRTDIGLGRSILSIVQSKSSISLLP